MADELDYPEHFRTLPHDSAAVVNDGHSYIAHLHPDHTGRSVSRVSKRDRHDNVVWSVTLPRRTWSQPSLRFSDDGRLLVLVPELRHDAFATLMLYEISHPGAIIASAHIDTIRLVVASVFRCIQVSAEARMPFIFLTYLIQDGVEPASVRHERVSLYKKKPISKSRI